jgi:hypothetical protein
MLGGHADLKIVRPQHTVQTVANVLVKNRNGVMTMTNTDFDFDPMPGKCAGDKGPEIFNAAFPDNTERRLVINWMVGIKAAFGIDSNFATDEGGSKLTHIAVTYPMETISMLADKTLGPAGDCLDRLEARGFIVRPVKFNGENVVVCAIPLDEALRQAKVWADGDCDEARDCMSLTAIVPTPQGFFSGTVETI